MKLLFDANISRRIIPLLQDFFPGSSHVLLLGFSGETPDTVIWDYAKENGFTIVSADRDFVALSSRMGAPPQVIRLEHMDYSTDEAAALIRRNALILSQFGLSQRQVLTLRRSRPA